MPAAIARKPPSEMKLLGISGSLRRVSTNSALLRALADNAPDDVTIEISELIGELPIFNSDREGDLTPCAVEAFGRQIHEADGLIFACPEYAHGIPGGLKNALDWMVSRDEIPNKPAMLVRASTRSDHALSALQEVLRTMSLRLMPEVGFAVHLLGKAAERMEEILSAAEARDGMRQALARFDRFIRAERSA
ncbi:NADPH-dependent FMN reductase [Rhizobium sp. TH2]|uniref:NADPH-dependent FMN reductase n=1 Tax=Rhizobium sp. TH2 TaxID=2775403 RepID=UPI00280BFCD0|nr:NADPH-dependent FMN reductase [Rhizobium sp. TH2]